MIKMMMNKMTDKKAIAGGKNKAGDEESSGFKEKDPNQMPGFSGNIYQSKWLIWYLLKGWSSRQYKFELGTEVEAAGKYDDMVFKYKKVVDGNERDHFIIMQSKHKANIDKKITYQDVLTDANVDLGLVKYYNSFVESKNAKMFKDSEIEHAIIYTNARFDMVGKIPEKDENWKELGSIRNITEEMKLKQGDILSAFKIKGGKFYKFKIDLVLPVLKPMILEYEYYKIARKLIECLNNKNKYLSLDDIVLKHYSHLLLTEVIVKESKMFRDDFLSESYDDVQNDTGRKKLRRALDKVLNDEGLKIEEIAKNPFKWRRDFEKFEQTRQIWPADIDDADLIEFLKKAIFAIEQPDERKLGKTILDELRKQFPTYDTDFIYSNFCIKVQDWMKGVSFLIDKSENISKNKFISFDDINNFFEYIIEKFNKIVLKGPIADYDRHIQEYKINFIDLKFDSAVKAFLDSQSDQRILSIISKHIVLSSIKLYMEITKIVKLENFIYIKLSSSNNHSLNSVIETFESESTDLLLVIEWDCDETKLDDWSDKIKEMIDAIHNHDQKKLIIISNRHDILETFFQNDFPIGTKSVERKYIANTLENLEMESQERFLNAMVKFQGTNAKLKDFIVNDDLKKMIDADILQKILKKEDVNIGKSLKEMKGDMQNFYIERTFMRKMENNENLYLISEISETDLCSENQNFQIFDEFEFSTQNEIDTFKCVVDENKTKSVYLLKKKSDSFTLLKKSKDIFEDSDFRKALKCEGNKGEINLISGVAGTGKSTLFARLSQKIKNRNPELWVIKIDLNAVSSKLNKIKKSKRDIQLETVVDLLHHGAEHQSKLEKTIFEYRIRNKNVELLLDGFDEVCPSYKSVVLKMIQILENETTIKTIWISTRPYDSILKDMKKKFENFYVKHYRFEPLTVDNQKDYLKNIWRQSIGGVDEKFFKRFVEELFKLLNNKMKADFLGLPLHAMLIGNTFKDTFVELRNTGKSEISPEQRQQLSEMVDLSTLYDKFIRFKCKIYCKDKNSANVYKEAGKYLFNESHRTCLKKCKILALDSLLNENELKIFLTEKKLKELRKYKHEIEERGDAFGIANQIVNGKPQFIHKTFAEYFVAMFFIENFKTKEKESRKYVKHFLKNMINVESSVICDFIDSKLNNESNFIKKNDKYVKVVKKMDKKKLYNVLERKWQNIGEILINNGIKINIKSKEKTIFHPASKLNRLKNKKPILGLILDNMNLKKKKLKLELQKKEGYFDDTPLLVAARYGIFNNVKIIFEKCKEMEILDDILTDTNKCNENIIHVSVKCDDTFFSNLLNLLKSESSILKDLLNQNNSDGKDPLMAAVILGQHEKLKAIQNLLIELESSTTSNLLNKIYVENNIHSAVQNLRNDELFTYFSDLLISNPDKLKTLLTKTDNDGSTPFDIVVCYGQRKKFETMWNLCGELDISIDSVLFNEFEDGSNIIHTASAGFCNDDFFAYLLNLLKSNPDKLKTLLIKKAVNGYTPFDVTVYYGRRNKFETMWNLCGELDISTDIIQFNESENGENIIHIASASNCNFDFFTYLLDLLKSNPEKLKPLLTKKDNKDWTPFDAAVFNGYRNKFEAMWKLCEELDISTDIVLFNESESGENIIHLAMNIKCNDDCFSYLLDLLKSKPSKLKTLLIKKNDEGRTPIDVAEGQELKLNFLLNTQDELDDVSN